VHAGLECGLLLARYPNLDCVSVGPTIEHAHSPDERLKIAAVMPCHDWLRATLSDLAKHQNGGALHDSETATSVSSHLRRFAPALFFALGAGASLLLGYKLFVTPKHK
jgi:hypothetical protein